MRFFILLAVLSSTTLFAQEESGPKRQCRILFFQPPPGAPQKLFLHDGANAQEVILPSQNLSPGYPLPEGNLTLTMVMTPPVPPATINPSSPRVIIPAAMTEFYLLVTRDSKNPVIPIRLQAVDASARNFKKGQMLWLNLTEYPISGTVGSRKFQCKPNSRVILDSPAEGTDGYLVDLTFQLPNDPRPRPLSRTSWGHDPNGKMVVMIYNEEGRRAPKVSGFLDAPPPPEEKAQ